MTPRALVVEDVEDTRTMLADLLRHEGWQADTAADGAEAVGRFWLAVGEGRPYKFIVLDLAMAPVDGFTAAKEIRRAEQEGHAPPAFLLGFTGYREDVLSPAALKTARFDALMEKPGDPAEIKRIAAEVMGCGGGRD